MPASFLWLGYNLTKGVIKMENAVLERRSKELYRITKKVVRYCEETADFNTLLNLAQAVGNADALAYLFPEREFCALSAEAHEKLDNALRNFRKDAG